MALTIPALFSLAITGALLSDKVFAQAATNTAIYAIASLFIVIPAGVWCWRCC